MAKKAFLCGINYPGTSHALRGCVNDVMFMADVLKRHFGFKNKEVRLLTDHAATTANIIDRLNWLVEGAQPGDILYFHYSGHGAQMVDTNYDNDVEPDGKDEIICPVDLNWRDKVIRDEDLKAIFDRVPAGVKLTVMLDCCHSGSGMDHSYQYQPLGSGQATNFQLQDVAKEFGPDSPERNRGLDMPADIASRGIGMDLPVRKRAVLSESRDIDETGLLISGCQSNQTSADAYIQRKYQGAATYFLRCALEKYNYDVDHKTIVDFMNDKLSKSGYTQRPELNGSIKLFGEKFLK